MSADLGGVLSAATAYGDQREAEGRTEVQATVAQLETDLARTVGERNTLAAELDRTREAFEAYRAAHPEPTPAPDPTPAPEPEPVRQVIIGMSSPRDVWDQRVREVGRDGLGARRIFGDLTDAGTSQEAIIREAIRDNLIPVISYKGTPTTRNLTAVRDFLRSLNTTVTATYWHEPWGDAPDPWPRTFVARSEQFLDVVQSPDVKVGQFLNGWLLNNRVDDFASLTSPKLLQESDWFGIDTYEEGTIEAPKPIKPASRIPLLAKFMRDNGIPDKPVVIGEYNGYSGESIAAAGEAILSMPNMWIACMWNSTTGKGHVLTGDRLRAFKDTLADPRVRR